MHSPTHLDRLAKRFLEANRLIHKNMRPEKAVDPMTFLRFETLHYVKNNENPTMKDVASHFRITPPSATSLVNKLVNERYLARCADKCDRRVVKLSITPLGVKMMKEGHNRITESIKEMLSRLNSKECKDLMRILEKLSNTHKK